MIVNSRGIGVSALHVPSSIPTDSFTLCLVVMLASTGEFTHVNTYIINSYISFSHGSYRTISESSTASIEENLTSGCLPLLSKQGYCAARAVGTSHGFFTDPRGSTSPLVPLQPFEAMVVPFRCPISGEGTTYVPVKAPGAYCCRTQIWPSGIYEKELHMTAMYCTSDGNVMNRQPLPLQRYCSTGSKTLCYYLIDDLRHPCGQLVGICGFA